MTVEIVKTNNLSLVDMTDDELMEQYFEDNDINAIRILYSRNEDSLESLSESKLLALYQNGYSITKGLLYNLAVEKELKVSDELLVLMTQWGSKEASTYIVEKYVDYVKKTVLNLKSQGRYNRGDDDEDLIQNGYIGFYKALRDFKIERKRPFKIFVKHVIKRHIDSIISRSGNNKMKTLNDSLSYHSPVSKYDTENTFEHLLKTEEYQPEHHLIVTENFWEVWETLSETEKSVLWYYADDYSYGEIGEIVFRDSHKTVNDQIKAVDNTMQRIKTKRVDFIERIKKL